MVCLREHTIICRCVVPFVVLHVLNIICANVRAVCCMHVIQLQPSSVHPKQAPRQRQRPRPRQSNYSFRNAIKRARRCALEVASLRSGVLLFVFFGCAAGSLFCPSTLPARRTRGGRAPLVGIDYISIQITRVPKCERMIADTQTHSRHNGTPTAGGCSVYDYCTVAFLPPGVAVRPRDVACCTNTDHTHTPM